MTKKRITSYTMSKFDPRTDIPSLAGRIAIVTGGNRGIGYHITLELARHGATVYLATRSETAAATAIDRIEEEAPEAKGRVRFLHLDLSTVRGAKKSAGEFLRVENQLHILVHNAGLLVHSYRLSSDGVEDTMVVNHLAQFEFTRVLMPTLLETSKTADVRVVTHSSRRYKEAPPGGKFFTLDEINDTLASGADDAAAQQLRYSRSKLANLLFARELQARFRRASSTALAISVNPGDVATESVKDIVRGMVPFGKGLVASLVGMVLLTPAQGAYTALFAATSPLVRRDEQKFGGAYLVPFGRLETIVGNATDDRIAERFWDASEKIVDELLSRQ
ncbi:NAD(P)-binding protein [Auricularia subglabra TFB-10046 SS5]|nr:NAD(P)-binding protein [Auricularia subglabra TFB-10046 SS5]